MKHNYPTVSRLPARSSSVLSRIIRDLTMLALGLGFALSANALSAAGVESTRSPARAQRLVGDACLSCCAGSVHPEVGEIRGSEVAIKADIVFGKVGEQPSGTMRAQFRGVDMVMTASTLQWIVASPKQVELKGSCLLDDSEGFTFQMKVEKAKSEGKSRVRLKVWETENPAHVVFDNQRDESWSAPVKSTGELSSGDLHVG